MTLARAFMSGNSPVRLPKEFHQDQAQADVFLKRKDITLQLSINPS